MSKLLVILGATGNQGGSVFATYINKPEWRVRAVTRDPSKPAAKKLEAQGAEVVAADFNDVESLEAAFQGANMVFAVTDFWAPFFSATTPSKLAPQQTIPQYCFALELQHGINIATALSTHLSSLTHLILSTLVDTTQHSSGKYPHIYHFTSKAAITAHIRAAHPPLFARTSLLYMGSYMSNVLVSPLHRPRRQPDGSYVLAWPQAPDTLEPFVDAGRDTGAFVVALEQLGPWRKLLGVGDWRSGEEFMRAWCAVVGVKGVYRQMPVDELMRLVPNRDLAVEIGESRAFCAEFGWVGREDGVLMPGELGVKTTPLEDFLERERASLVDGNGARL